jgi:predicted kinase
MKIKILKGLPGSGKSTWARQFVEENKDWVRVNRDDLRNMRGFYWLPKQEEMITKWEFEAVKSAIDSGYNVILDATNLNHKHIDKLKSFVDKSTEFEVYFEEKYFDVSPEECIKRDLKRPNSVGAEVIWGMYEKYINPPQTYKEDKSLPHAIIVDIDGTLASNESGRSPFDWNRVGEDNLNDWVCSIVIDYVMGSKGTVIVFSGRDSICAEVTAEWLKSYGVPFDYLYMRPEGNVEKDSIIKKRLFENHVRGKYYVDYVIDDRDQVVRMWRKELGLNCLQVNFGNF